MTPENLVQQYVAQAIERVRQGDADRVTDVLRDILPDVLRALHEMATSDASSQGQRRWALSAILNTFTQVVKFRVRTDKAEIVKARAAAKREAESARKAVANAAGKIAHAKVVKAQKRIAKQLKQATAMAEGTDV